MSDAILILENVMLGRGNLRCLDAADSGVVDMTDALNLLKSVFFGSYTIPAPGQNTCGQHPTSNSMNGADYQGC